MSAKQQSRQDTSPQKLGVFASLRETLLPVIRGERRGAAAFAMRGLLSLAEVPYSLAMRLRNARYDRGHNVHRVSVPVVSVGNITLGGTGKTPMVGWLARRLRDCGLRVAIVSRGYGARAGGPNDEALELAERLPDVSHVQDVDRVAAARRAIDEHRAQIIVLDDGFQHRRLARDLDLVLIDALDPFGSEHVFPRGLLREPLAGLERADVVILTRADMVPLAERERIREIVMRHAPRTGWAEATLKPCALRAADGRELNLDALHGTSVAAVCAIGNPLAFRKSLEQAGTDIRAFREFPDHHDFHLGDISSLAKWARESGASMVVCTHKDLVKLRRNDLGGLPLWALAVEIEMTVGAEALGERLTNIATLV